jgi:hypothetical protein
MPARPAQPRPVLRRWVLRAMLAALAAVLVVLGIRQLGQQPFFAPDDPALRASIEKRIAGSSTGSLLMPVFRETFPDRYRSFLDRQFAVARAARDGRITRAQAEASFAGQTRREIAALIDDSRKAMAAAPDPLLHDWAIAVRDLVVTMQRDAPELCAGYAFGVAPAGLPTPPSIEIAGANLLVASLRAARGGEDDPQERDLESLDPAAEQALHQALAQIAPPAIRLLLADPERLRQVPPAEQCQATVSYYTAIAAMPPEHGAAVIAFEMAPGA